MITVYRFEYPAQFRNPFCKGTVEYLNEPEGKNNIHRKEQQYDGKFVPDACKKTVLYRLYINCKFRTIQTDGMFIGFSLLRYPAAETRCRSCRIVHWKEGSDLLHRSEPHYHSSCF